MYRSLDSSCRFSLIRCCTFDVHTDTQRVQCTNNVHAKLHRLINANSRLIFSSFESHFFRRVFFTPISRLESVNASISMRWPNWMHHRCVGKWLADRVHALTEYSTLIFLLCAEKLIFYSSFSAHRSFSPFFVCDFFVALFLSAMNEPRFCSVFTFAWLSLLSTGAIRFVSFGNGSNAMCRFSSN